MTTQLALDRLLDLYPAPRLMDSATRGVLFEAELRWVCVRRLDLLPLRSGGADYPRPHDGADRPRAAVADGFDRLSETPAFRRYAFGTFADRLAELMTLAEAVAFQRLDQRLAQALLGLGAVVPATHQALADELGTVREIVTRLLRRSEREGWVRLGRERVERIDAGALRTLAAGGDATGERGA